MAKLSLKEFRIVEYIDSQGKSTFKVQKLRVSAVHPLWLWLLFIVTLGIFVGKDYWDDLTEYVVEHLDADKRHGRLLYPTGKSKEYLIAYIYAYIEREKEQVLLKQSLPPEQDIYHYL